MAPLDWDDADQLDVELIETCEAAGIVNEASPISLMLVTGTTSYSGDDVEFPCSF